MGQDLRPTVSSFKRPRFPDSDSDDAVTVLGDTVKRQRTHDLDDDLLMMEDSIRELDDLLDHEGATTSTTEKYDCWDDDYLLRSLIDEFDLLPDSVVAASATDEAAVVPQLTTHLGHHHLEIEEGPRTTDERELDDEEEDLITEFFNHIGGEDDEDPNQDHVHQATEPDHTTLLITIIPHFQIIILPVVVGNLGRPRASALHVLLTCLLTIIII